MANGNGSGDLPEDQASHVVAVGATRQDEGFCTVGYKAPRLALPADRLRCRPSGILRATIHSAIRAPCGKDGAMKRAARHKTGSVVFDKRRKTWNFLWWEGGERRTRKIGTLKEFATKGAAWQAAEILQSEAFGQPSEIPSQERDTVRALAVRYEQERLPSRHSTARMYRSWLRNHILPRWGDEPIHAIQPRAVELWLRELNLSPKSKAHVRSMLHLLMEFAMWSGALEISRNPIDLVVVKGATKRTRQPRSLTVDEFRKFVQHLEEPFRTLALLCVCFGLRISEALALKWSDVDWLNGRLCVERGIVRQHVGDVKTTESRKQLSTVSGLLELMKRWKQTTQFSGQEDWMFASPVQIGRLPWSYPRVWG